MPHKKDLSFVCCFLFSIRDIPKKNLNRECFVYDNRRGFARAHVMPVGFFLLFFVSKYPAPPHIPHSHAPFPKDNIKMYGYNNKYIFYIYSFILCVYAFACNINRRGGCIKLSAILLKSISNTF